MSPAYHTRTATKLPPAVQRIGVSEHFSLRAYAGFLHIDRLFNRVIRIAVIGAAGGDLDLVAGHEMNGDPAGCLICVVGERDSAGMRFTDRFYFIEPFMVFFGIFLGF
ncbi:hypothetical protein D3C75_1078450 [compost metagenome]